MVRLPHTAFRVLVVAKGAGVGYAMAGLPHEVRGRGACRALTGRRDVTPVRAVDTLRRQNGTPLPLRFDHGIFTLTMISGLHAHLHSESRISRLAAVTFAPAGVRATSVPRPECRPRRRPCVRQGREGRDDGRATAGSHPACTVPRLRRRRAPPPQEPPQSLERRRYVAAPSQAHLLSRPAARRPAQSGVCVTCGPSVDASDDPNQHQDSDKPAGSTNSRLLFNIRCVTHPFTKLYSLLYPDSDPDLP